jgi:hypothetical protein
VRFPCALLIAAGFGSGLPGNVYPQQIMTTIESQGGPPVAAELSQTAVAVPDSVRQKVGYQHWKGGAIGGVLGAAAGLLLTAFPIGCSDCSSRDAGVVRATFIGAGLGGAFGFLVGAASPKYEWQAAAPDTGAPPSE